MTDQHYHRATDEQWAQIARTAEDTNGDGCSALLELRDRIEGLEKLHAAVVDLNQRFNLDPLVDRVEALEATQHAHIEAKAAAERAAAVSDHDKQGWKDRLLVKTETTYGSDTTIPGLGEHCAPGEWVGHHLATARALVRDIGNRPVTVEGSFEIKGQSYSYKADAVPTAEPAADARQLTLVERVADAIVAEAGPIPAHGHAWDPEARAAIRVVAAAAAEMHPDRHLSWERVASWLERAASSYA